MRLCVSRALLGVLVLLPVALAACGGDDDAASTPPPAPTSATTAPTPAASATTAPSAPTATETAASEPTQASSTATVSGTATTEATAEPAPSSGYVYGFNIFARGDDTGAEFNQQTIAAVQEAGFGWVRIQIYWSDVQREPEWWDPLPIDRVVEQYAGAGVNILATVSRAPEWALDPSGAQMLADYATWQNFMFFLADRYRGRVQAWELWNEPNHAITVGGTVRLEDYCRLLESGYYGVKAADPDALVVFGGLTPTGVNDPSIAIDDVDYLRSFYELDGGYYAEFFDVLGMHANATNNPPDTMYPDNPGTGGWSQDPSFYFRRVEQLHAVMAEFGDDRPAWITEFGWTTANQAPGYEYGVDNTEQEQAEYLVRAFEIANTEWPWCTGMFVWNLNYAIVAPPENEMYPWSVLNGDWSPRPAYEALAVMPK
jgi:hypothetical protein